MYETADGQKELGSYRAYVESSIEDYKAGLGRFRERLPVVGDKYLQFTAACFAGGVMTEQQKHLIALGISIVTQDEYCIMYHTHQALTQGATADAVLETVAVCAAFGGGSALSQGVTMVQDVLEAYSGQNAVN